MKHKKWNDAERQFVMNHYKELPDNKLAAKLGEMTGETISAYQVQELRTKLGLVKSKGRPKSKKQEEQAS